ncbi:Uu.00g145600.m01.CDS01 [Anthostomella pinea]|uniref:Uu.00g145600.m01.CDS01 n=1 Tax=Anthostomella pinea TaxID=933095 RepID=A0AAI8VRR0_9PEZI|nr:Uu.00g145600.m01.CDS01 [Anthostomella pinea]
MLAAHREVTNACLHETRNSPYILGMRATILPIAAGNTVVLKGSELSPRSMWAIVCVLQEAGLPRGVLNFISTDISRASSVSKAIIAHPQVKKVNFTGSTAVGRIVAVLAAQHLKPALLELGGQAPAIVCEDANLDLAAQCCVAGAFMYAGQCCMATERIIVQKSDETALMINPQGVKKVTRLLEDAEAKGATITRPGSDAVDSLNTGSRLRPSVLTGVTCDMDTYRNENFGPTVSIFEFETDEEALAIAHDTDYGLAAAVYTEDLRRGLRFARALEIGAVHINNMSLHDESALPHGGFKATGYGKFNTVFGLSE